MDTNDMDIVLSVALDSGFDISVLRGIVENTCMPKYLGEVGIEENAKTENFFEKTILRFTNDMFIEHFRMSRESFEILTNIIGNTISDNKPYEEVPLPKKILFAVWVLAKQESFLSTGDRFGFSKSTGHGIFAYIIKILSNLMPQFIKWPEYKNYETISKIFQTKSYGFPGVVGAIDGCHIPCKQPIGNPTDFYNRKGFHSIILQGICDHRMKFTDVFIGMPGRMHDARVFRKSPIFNHLDMLLPQSYHIIGDTAYPLMQQVLTPFRDNGHLSRKQGAYNKKLSSIRSTIERAFGQLKGKFRRLKYLDISNFDLGQEMISAACMLHNFIIEHNETGSEEIIDEIENMDVPDHNESNVDDRNNEAIRKRNNICDML